MEPVPLEEDVVSYLIAQAKMPCVERNIAGRFRSRNGRNGSVQFFDMDTNLLYLWRPDRPESIEAIIAAY